MPPHRLTDGRHVVAAVEAVLAGANPPASAAEAGLDLGDLSDAVEAYRTGGRAALDRREESAWFHALVKPTDWPGAESTFSHRIAPAIDQLDDGRAAWWFLRKHPYWRLRISTTDFGAAARLLDNLAADSVITGWTPGIYEPETAAFGGPLAMDIVHDLFCADTRGIMAYLRHDPPPVGRRELSILLIRALQQHARLDWFESADVFERVARMRPAADAIDGARIHSLAEQLQPLLALPASSLGLFASDGPLNNDAPILAAFINAGQRLGDAAGSGVLGRGVRAVIAHIIIFHWNRLGVSANAQAILARAATTAILDLS